MLGYHREVQLCERDDITERHVCLPTMMYIIAQLSSQPILSHISAEMVYTAWCVDWIDESFMCSRVCTFGAYFEICEATNEINTKTNTRVTVWIFHHSCRYLISYRTIRRSSRIESSCLICSFYVPVMTSRSIAPWASCKIRKIAGAHAPGMPETFSPPPRVSNPDMHHGTCVTHVPWCMPGSLTRVFLWIRGRGKHSRHSRRMRNPQFCVSGKRPMDDLWGSTTGYRARNIDFIHGDVHGMAYKNMVLNFPLYTLCR